MHLKNFDDFNLLKIGQIIKVRLWSNFPWEYGRVSLNSMGYVTVDMAVTDRGVNHCYNIDREQFFKTYRECVGETLTEEEELKVKETVKFSYS